jgi:hypothetical protein
MWVLIQLLTFSRPFTNMKWKYTNIQEMGKIMKFLKTKDSSRYDAITSRIFKSSIPSIISPLTYRGVKKMYLLFDSIFGTKWHVVTILVWYCSVMFAHVTWMSCRVGAASSRQQQWSLKGPLSNARLYWSGTGSTKTVKRCNDNGRMSLEPSHQHAEQLPVFGINLKPTVLFMMCIST